MNYKKFTAILTFGIIPALIVLVLIYDAVAIHFGGTEASISSLIITTSYKMPFMVFCISFASGVLCGHLWWRMLPNKDTVASGIDKIKPE